MCEFPLDYTCAYKKHCTRILRQLVALRVDLTFQIWMQHRGICIRAQLYDMLIGIQMHHGLPNGTRTFRRHRRIASG